MLTKFLVVGRLCTFELTTYPSLIVSEILLSMETIVMRTSFKIRDVLRLWVIAVPVYLIICSYFVEN